MWFIFIDVWIIFFGIVILYLKILLVLMFRKMGFSFLFFVVGCYICFFFGMIIGLLISFNFFIFGGVGILVVVVVEVVVEGRGRVWVIVSLIWEVVGRDVGELFWWVILFYRICIKYWIIFYKLLNIKK